MMILPVHLQKTGRHYTLVLMALIIVVAVIGISIFTPINYIVDIALFLVILHYRYALTIMLGTLSFIIDIIQGLPLGTGLLHLIIILIIINATRKWQHTPSFLSNWILFITTFLILKCIDLSCGMVELSGAYVTAALLTILIYPYIYKLSFKMNLYKMYEVK